MVVTYKAINILKNSQKKPSNYFVLVFVGFVVFVCEWIPHVTTMGTILVLSWVWIEELFLTAFFPPLR